MGQGYVDIEESLHPWDKAHLVMMYSLFNVLFCSVSNVKMHKNLRLEILGTNRKI